MYIRFGISGSALPATIQRLERKEKCHQFGSSLSTSFTVVQNHSKSLIALKNNFDLGYPINFRGTYTF